MLDEDALQWLSTRAIPSRWSHDYSLSTPETERTWKRLQWLNRNDVPTYASQAFEGFPMEVLYEGMRQHIKQKKLSG